ncbi:MAG: PIN domain-containing protein [Burkholderiaceae bacterium]
MSKPLTHRNSDTPPTAAYENILETLTVLPIEASLSPVYARLRTVLDAQGTPMGANDLPIAAQALAMGATVVSADAAFARVPGLQVSNWLA